MCKATCRAVEGTYFSHCGGCHETFATVTDFDAHRKNHRCTSPADAGLTFRSGLWSGASRVDLTMLATATDRWNRA